LVLGVHRWIAFEENKQRNADNYESGEFSGAIPG